MMSTEVPLSVLITVYDDPRYLSGAVQSVLADMPNAEVLIGYDAALEPTVRVGVQDCRHPRVVHVASSAHRLLAGMVNLQLRCAANELIVWLGDDVTVVPGGLRSAVDAFQSVFPDGRGVIALKPGYCAFPLTTKQYLRELYGLEVLAWPEYRQRWWDTELGKRAEASGRLRWAGELEHHRQWTGGEGEDEKVFQRREWAGFPNRVVPPGIMFFRAG